MRIAPLVPAGSTVMGFPAIGNGNKKIRRRQAFCRIDGSILQYVRAVLAQTIIIVC